MGNVARRLCLASLAAMVVVGCGTSKTDVRPPPGQQQVTLHVAGMGERLKLF
jgi:hypothetical protein